MSGKVLLIDDDQDFRASVKTLLEDHGYEVYEADSGREGLKKVLRCKPDVILLDIMMESDSEGYGVTYSLKYRERIRRFRDTPLFMVSSIEGTSRRALPDGGRTRYDPPRPVLDEAARFHEAIREFWKKRCAGAAVHA